MVVMLLAHKLNLLRGPKELEVPLEKPDQMATQDRRVQLDRMVNGAVLGNPELKEMKVHLDNLDLK